MLLAGVDDQLLRVRSEEIPDRLEDHAEVFVDDRRRMSPLVLLREALPGIHEVIHVLADLLFGAAFRFGAGDEAEALGLELLDQAAKPVALARIFDLARDAQVIALRHEDEIPAGDADLGGDPGPLRPPRPFDHLHQDLLAGLGEIVDPDIPAGPPAGLLSSTVAAARVLEQDVSDI
jgi:hypothetical protein